MSSFSMSLLQRGWCIFNLNSNNDVIFTEEEKYALNNWETVFNTAFQLSTQIKIESGEYRVEHGVSVGYRHDDEREFFESRMTSDGNCEPDYSPYVSSYTSIVKNIYSACNKIAITTLNDVSDELGWDRNMLIDLTDIKENGVLPMVPITSTKKKSNKSLKVSADDSNLSIAGVQQIDTTNDEPTTRIQYSSSLLRICKYLHQITSNTTDNSISKKSVSFGAHTDSSFITIAPISSSPGLEVVDQLDNKWVCPELSMEGVPPKGSLIIFVGEFLQVLTKNRFKATVHRVVEFPIGSNSHNHNNDVNDIENVVDSQRLSCPYLIRGKNDAIINMNDVKYSHRKDALTADKVPDLDGTSMKLLHKLLDLKRQKCFRDNDSKPGNWVLSAYPIECMPPDDEL